jgi:hypothetical protein
MARMVKSIIESGAPVRCPPATCAWQPILASGLLRKALDAFARLDTKAALDILKEDDLIDKEFDGFVRKLITYMMEDPRTISASLDLLFWPRPSSALATTRKMWPSSSFTWSRAKTCATPRWTILNRLCCSNRRALP